MKNYRSLESDFSHLLIKDAIAKCFFFLLTIRFWTEALDRQLGLFLTPVISISLIFLSFYYALFFVNYLPGYLKRVRNLWVLFIASSIISWGIGEVSVNEEAFIQVTRYLLVFSVFHLVFVLTKDSKNRKRLYFSIMLGVIPGIIAAIYQGIFRVGWYGKIDENLNRAYGLSTHPVVYGILLVLVLALCWMLKRNIKKDWRTQALWIIFLAVIPLSLYFTYSRTAWLMVSMMVGIYVMRVGGIKQRVVLFGGILVVALAGPFLFWDRFADLIGLWGFLQSGSLFTDEYHNHADSSMQWRIYSWYYMLSAFLENWFVGYGPGQGPYVNAFENKESHSAFVDVLVEQGIVGGVIFLALSISIFKIYWPFKKIDESVMATALTSGVLIVIYSAMLFSVSFLYQTHNLIILSVMLSVRLNLRK